MDDPSTPVRLLAATHSLAWSKDRAVEVLREIELADGCMSIDAKYTLNSFSEGKLDLDW